MAQAKYQSPIIYDRVGAPSFWAYMNGPGPTFPGDAGDVADLMRGTAAGVRSGGCTWAVGPRGRCLSVNGSNGIARFASSMSNSFTGNFTVTLRFCPLSLSGIYPVLVSKDISFAGSGWLIGFRDSTGKFTATVPSGTGATAGTACVVGTWYHGVAVYSGTTSVTATIYLNGIQVGSASVGTLSTTTNDLVIGADQGSSSTPNVAANYSNAIIEDVRIYPRTLSAAEIARDYADPDWRLRPPSRTRLFVMSHSLFRRNLYDRTGSRGVA